jgi:hypothetical protein
MNWYWSAPVPPEAAALQVIGVPSVTGIATFGVRAVTWRGAATGAGGAAPPALLPVTMNWP